MKTIVKLNPLKLNKNSFHLAVEIKICKKLYRFIVDTGASQTVIGVELAEKLKLEIQEPKMDNITMGIGQESLSPKFAYIKSMKINDLKIKKVACIILPLDHINKTYQSLGLKKIDGIIGIDLLLMLNSQINLQKMKLVFNTKTDNIKYQFKPFKV